MEMPWFSRPIRDIPEKTSFFENGIAREIHGPGGEGSDAVVRINEFFSERLESEAVI
jgi:hypothetical protein